MTKRTTKRRSPAALPSDGRAKVVASPGAVPGGPIERQPAGDRDLLAAGLALAKANLGESQPMLQLVLDTIPVRVFWKNRDSVYLGCNQLFARDAGLPNSQALVGKSDAELVWSAQAAQYRRDDQQFMERGEAQLRYEEPQTTPDGQLITLLTSKVPLRDPQGNIIGILGVYDDITEARQAEELLRLREAALRAAANVVLIADRQGMIVWTNAAFTRETGYTAEEVLGKNPRILKSGEHPPAFYKELWRTISSGQVWHGEFHNRHKDGTLLVEDSTITPVPDNLGRITHFIAVKQNITERKRVELAASRLAAIVECSDDAIIGKNLNGIITSWNRGAEKLFGYAAREMVGASIRQLIPVDRQDEEQEIMAKIRRGERVEHFETVRRNKDGQARHISVTVSPIKDTNGQLIGVSKVARDITERKQAEELLRQRVELQSQLSQLATVVPGVLFSFKLQPDGRQSMPYASEAIASIFGLRPADVVADATPALAMIHADDLARVQASIVESAQSLRLWQAEFRVERTRLGEIWVEGHSMPRREPDGGVLWHGFLQNVTERKAGETRLRESQRLLQSTLDALSAHIAILDEVGEIIAVNALWMRFAQANNFAGGRFGVGNNYLQVCESATGDCAQEAGAVAAGIRSVMANEQGEFHLEYPCHSPAEQRWFEVRVTRFDATGPVRIVVAHENITERKKSETRLRESEDLLQSALDAIPMHIAILDATGMIVAVNAMWKNFATANNSKSDAFCLGSNYLKICECAVGDCSVEAAAVVTGIRAVMANQQSEFRLEYPCHSPEEQRWFLMRVTRFGDEGPVRLVVAHENITERVRAEEERKSIEVQLRHAQKLESIGQLAAGIAHEINTPTQYIGDNTKFVRDAFTQLLPALATLRELLAAVHKNEVTPELLKSTEALLKAADLDYLSTELPKAIDESLQGVERVAKIVRAMKDFSHPGTTEKVQVDLNRAIESTLTVARNEWKYVAEMVTDFDPHLPPVLCLPGEFNQVILNLVVNAAHAIGDALKGGDRSKGTITVRTQRDGDGVEVQVRDTGTGIPEHARGRIFDPFFTTKSVGKGTGQGLAIARSVIVDKHGGTIAFETELGRGTVFIIRLPLTATPKGKAGRT